MRHKQGTIAGLHDGEILNLLSTVNDIDIRMHTLRRILKSKNVNVSHFNMKLLHYLVKVRSFQVKQSPNNAIVSLKNMKIIM